MDKVYLHFIGYGRVPPDYDWNLQLFETLAIPFLEETKLYFDTCEQSLRAEWKFDLEEDKVPFEEFYVKDSYVRKKLDDRERKHYKEVELRLHKVVRG